MGFENRDYFRDGSYSRAGAGQFLADAPMCKRIIICTVAVYVVQMFFPPFEGWFILDTEKVVGQAQIWRLLTYAFLHSQHDFWHIFMNMLILYWFGRTVETTYGGREFLWIYLVGAVASGLAYVGLELATPSYTTADALGASGAVMAVTCIFVMWNPRATIRIYFLFPIEARFLLLFYLIVDLHPVLLRFAGREQYTGIAHACHLGGLLFGFLYYKNNWKLESTWNRLTKSFSNKTGSRRNIKIHRPSVSESDSDFANTNLGTNSQDPQASQPKTRADEKFDSKINEILDKIAKEGEESLTKTERKILEQASQRYRNR